MNPLVSVIVPIYNTQAYLDRCIESILRQTYENMDIILVNDGSTDDSLSVCEKFADEDARIRLISQPNQGIVAAKKAGLRVCCGTYVMFVDSDDWVEPQLLASMVRTVSTQDCALVCTNVYMDWQDHTVEKRNAIPPGLYETGAIVKDLFYYRNTDDYGILPYSVAKLYKREMLQEVIAHIGNDIRYAEDKAIVFSCVIQNIKVCFTEAIYYHYYVRNGSACQSENQNYLVELTAFYKYAKRLFEGHVEREHLLRQLGKYLLQETTYAINDRLGLIVPGKPISLEPNRLDPSVFLDQKKKVVLYGAGKVGADYQKQMADYMHIEMCAWVDKNYRKYREEGLDVRPVEYIRKTAYDSILVAVGRQKVYEEIKKELTDMGIADEIILWGRPCGAPWAAPGEEGY